MANVESLRIDLEALQAWRGREESMTDVITVDLVSKFNATLDLLAESPAVGDTAPLLINYCLAQPTVQTALLGPDGHPKKGGFLPPIPLPRRMWAGSRLTFHCDFCVGDTVTRCSRIEAVTAKEGRTGALCFVTVRHRFEVDGRLVMEEEQDLVYREAATAEGAAKAAAVPAAPDGAYIRPAAVGPTLLFRYSALTFNGHRIHYDRPYAVNAEHYPGLVVHAPMQATWLLNFAREIGGSVPKYFTFRGLSPLFDHDTIWLHADEAGGRLKLWTAREGGPVGVSAEAVWA